MNDRARAISILQQARDTLAARLTQLVLESAEEISSDAEGDTYLSEIEQLYDQLGSKLQHVSVMLSQLPTMQEKPQAGSSAEQEQLESDVSEPGASGYGQQEAADETDASPAQAKLPGPTGDKPALPAPNDIVINTSDSFRDFAARIQAGDVEAAGRSLADLFGMDPQRGTQCAQFFLEAANKDTEFVAKAMSLRKELTQGNINSSLMLLYQCFGLQPYESIGVVQALKTRLS